MTYQQSFVSPMVNYGTYQPIQSGSTNPYQSSSTQYQPQTTDPSQSGTQQPQNSSSTGDIMGGVSKLGGQVIKSFMNPAFDSAGNFVGQSTVNGAADAASGAGGAMGTIMGKVVPLAGAALGGYGLIQGGSTPSNLLNGAESGASIGSMFAPGIGTLIGGGIGALVGGIRSLFHGPSQQELQGRSANDQAVGSIIQSATPQQIQEAMQGVKSGAWNNVNDPLSLIVMRDALQQQYASQNGGQRTPQTDAMAEQQAEALKSGLWNAETGGTQSVAQAYSPIQSMMAAQQRSNFTPQLASTTYGG